MDIKELESYFKYAGSICQPDEYDLRQRKLLHAISEYLIERDSPKTQIDDTYSKFVKENL
jgi:hypothetical protein